MKKAILETIKKMRDYNFQMNQEAQLANKIDLANYFAGKTYALEEVYDMIKEDIRKNVPWEV